MIRQLPGNFGGEGIVLAGVVPLACRVVNTVCRDGVH